MPRLVVPAVALALLAGCGGGDDEPTKERFVADANRICREGEARIAEVAAEAQGEIERAATAPKRERAVAAVLERSAEAYAPYMERLRALEAPEGLEEPWSRFLDGVQEGFDLIPELTEATREGDQETLSRLTTDFSRIAAETRPFAQENGLRDCLPEN